MRNQTDKPLESLQSLVEKANAYYASQSQSHKQSEAIITPIPSPPSILPAHPRLTRAIRRYHFLDSAGNMLYGAAEYAGEDGLWYFFLTKSGYKWFRTDLGVKSERRELVAGPPEQG